MGPEWQFSVPFVPSLSARFVSSFKPGQEQMLGRLMLSACTSARSIPSREPRQVGPEVPMVYFLG